MPRADRHFLPGHDWHIMDRCHEKSVLLSSRATSAPTWAGFFEAKKRFGLCVLN